MCNCKVISVASLCLLILMIVAVSLCLRSVEALHMGIKFNHFLITQETKPQDKGLHWLNGFSGFQSQPTNYFSISRKESCWAQDGQTIALEQAVFFSIKPEKMHRLFSDQVDYRQNLALHIAVQTKNHCTALNTQDFYKNREKVQMVMQAALEAVCLNFAGDSIKLEVQQLKSVEVNSTIETAIVNKMLVFERVRWMSNDRQVRKVLAQIETVNRIDGDMKIKQIRRTGDRVAKEQVVKTEQALDRELEQNQVNKLHSNFASDYGITTPTEMIKLYILTRLARVQGTAGHKFIAGANNNATIWLKQ